MSQKVWDRVRAELHAPEEYCVPNEEKVKKLAALIKIVFEMASVHPARGSGPLKSLLVDGIDEETLWEQLQTRNNPLLKYIRKYLKTAPKRTLQFLPEEIDSEVEEDEDDVTSTDESEKVEGSDDEVMDEDGEDFVDGDESDDEEKETSDDDEEDEDNDDESEEGTDSYDEAEEKKPMKGSKKRISGETGEGWDTDEELAMEAWLDATDELDTKHREKLENKEKRAKANTMDQEDDEEDEEEDDLDIVERAMYGSGDEEDEEDDFDPSTMRYEDFYVNDSKKGKPSAAGKQSKKRVAINIDESSGDEEEDFDMGDGEDDYVESDEDDEDDYGRSRKASSTSTSKKNSQLSSKNVISNNNNNSNKPPEFSTSYQRRLQELATQIEELEQELIAEKSWEMRGEVAAQHRPENSLLDVAVDVDRATKVAPVITQEYTSTLEELIIKRIEDSKFDDPKPRNAMAEVLTAEPGDDKDPIELSQEKSKLGLAEIYAEDFAKKMLNSDEKLSVETQALREEVVGLFGAVSRHLDALCHFYFTPRPVTGETSAKVLATQRSLPALEMEDIAPYSVQSDAAKMAPEELLAKKKGPRIMLLSSEELGRDDRKKRRRVQKDIYNREKRHADAQLDANVKRARREEEVLSKDKRVSVHTSAQTKGAKKHNNETGEFSRSSTFFSNLQKDVEAGVKSQQQAHKASKNGGNSVSARSSVYKL